MVRIFPAASNVFEGTVEFNEDIDCDKNVSINQGYDRTNVISKTGAYTAALTDDVIEGDTSGGAFSITLPAVATATGKIFTFIRTGAGVNALTIDGNGAETIDGNATDARMDAQYDSVTIYCNGTEWFIIAEKIA